MNKFKLKLEELEYYNTLKIYLLEFGFEKNKVKNKIFDIINLARDLSGFCNPKNAVSELQKAMSAEISILNE